MEGKRVEMIAVLGVDRRSHYRDMSDVICYGVEEDMRTYAGPWPIVAHPPCRTWSAYCRHQAKAPPGEKELAPFCVELLRQYGGVLEHPAHSTLFYHMRLPLPGDRPKDGVWSLQVSQAWWGDRRSKRTWLLFGHVDPADVHLPFRLHDPTGDRRRWQVMSRHQRSRTPKSMAEWLVATARTAKTNKDFSLT